MSLKVSSKRLNKLAKPEPVVEEKVAEKPKPAPRPKPSPAPRVAAPVIPQELVTAVSQSAQAAVAMSVTAEQLLVAVETMPRQTVTERPPVRLNVVRDKRGLIEYIDVEPKYQ